MKKTCSILLALAMVLALSVPALATANPITPAGGESSKTVEAIYEEGQEYHGDNVYSITLTWSAIDSLVYKDGNTRYTWDPDKLQYNGSADSGSWTTGNTSFTLTVENRSDDGITAIAAFNAANGLTAECTGNGWSNNECRLVLESAAKNLGSGFVGTGVAQSGSIAGTVTVTGGSISGDTAVGTITVKLYSTWALS